MTPAVVKSILRFAVALLVAVIILAGAPGCPVGAPLRAGQLDSLARYVDALGGFGFVGQVVVAEGDSILVERAAGAADAAGRLVGSDTRFALGSITKSFTGATVVRLAGRGVLSLDDSLPR